MDLKKLVAALFATTVLSACSTLEVPGEFRAIAKEQKRSIDQTLQENKFQKVVVLDRPPQQIKEVDNSYRPDWLDESTKLASEELPLTLLIKEIVGYDIKIRYGEGVEPSKLESLFFEGTKEEALNVLALKVNYGITVVEGVVKIDKFVSKTFDLPTTIGTNNFQIGSNSGGGSSSDNDKAASGEIATTGSGDGQFSHSKAESYNLTEQIFNGINKMLTGEKNITTGGDDVSQVSTSSVASPTLGYVEKIEGVSSIIVRTSPSMMLMVEQYVKDMVDQLTQVVSLEVVVLEYQRDEGAEIGIDVDAVKNNGKYSLGFDLTSPTFADAIDTIGLGLKANEGSWSGSEMLINALRMTGDVSVTTHNRVAASNHMAQEIDLSSIQSYFASVKVTYEGSDNDNPTTSIETGEVRDGVKMLVVPNIQEDKVFLKLNGVLSKVLRLEEQTVENVTVISPRTRQARFNISGSYEYNKPFVVAHMRQETNEANKSEYLDATFGKSGTQRITDTLVVLTPRKVHTNSIDYR
ncbi:hypothetical protein [Vibrio sp. THAF190c]|uniref:hypothetical protein n=1 Tax=Vibrio sp. THAF190c TaxID=2587865 RepID=UPI001268DBAA|nr:hypothetical protein [Vibrio sp. THAF190c]QFT13393.1 hypothetical protein FIV04_25920 [Vibrio sp. THAF190c]